MSLPFLILAETIAYTVVFPVGHDDDGGGGAEAAAGRDVSKIKTATSSKQSSSSPSSSLALSSHGPSSKSVSIFLSGLVVGVGLSLVASYELKRTRLWQRVRLKLLSWLYDDFSSVAWTDGGLGDSDNTDDEGDDIVGGSSSRNVDTTSDTRLVDKFRKPIMLETITGTRIPGPDDDADGHMSGGGGCGSHVDLVSTDWTLTYGMSVDLLTIAPGSEIVPNQSKGVEFYYVVKGDGDLVVLRDSDSSSNSKNNTINNSDNNNRKKKKESIRQGMGFIVDPDTIRGFQARAEGKKNLVLLRATDSVTDTSSGSGKSQSESVTTYQNTSTSKLSSAKNMILAGLGKIQTMVEAYGTTDPVPTVYNENFETFDQ